MEEHPYNEFLKTASKEKWQRFGLFKRAGVVVPLFLVYSQKSIGIADFSDLKLVCDWLKETGMSILQLLPLNDTGFNFLPYDCESGFALEPVYLNMEDLSGVDTFRFLEEIKLLKEKFPITGRVNYIIKKEKLELLWHIYQEAKNFLPSEFKEYKDINKFWLKDYCLFKVIKEKFLQRSWEEWPFALKERLNLLDFEKENVDKIEFYAWLQWQAYKQFKTVKAYAQKKGILLMGDLPLLVSRDSADVWAKREYFKLHLSSGAPADMYYFKGQRWGMPTYNWENISKNNYDYIIEKLRYAENFYDIFRIDHVVGIFRIWSIPKEEPLESAGMNGFFDPTDERLWEEHGRRILSIMVKSTDMLACAEDLGTVPACSYKVLKELGIPGIEVLRWNKDWQNTYNFKSPQDYRALSIATLSTHDSSNIEAWWNFEAGTVDEELFKRLLREKNVDFEQVKEKLFEPEFSFYKRLRWKKEIDSVDKLLAILKLDKEQAPHIIDLYKGSYLEKEKLWQTLGLKEELSEKANNLFLKRIVEYIAQANSIFYINFLFDWLAFGKIFLNDDCWMRRINFPGTLSKNNWSYVMPLSLERMLDLDINAEIKEINEKSRRI